MKTIAGWLVLGSLLAACGGDAQELYGAPESGDERAFAAALGAGAVQQAQGNGQVLEADPKPAGGKGYTCNKVECNCTGDDGCNKMFSSSSCDSAIFSGSCDNEHGVQTCSCARP